MIFRFPVARTDKIGLAHSMRVARLYMKAYYPDETVMALDYNPQSISMDVHVVRGDEADIAYVCAHKFKEELNND